MTMQNNKAEGATVGLDKEKADLVRQVVQEALKAHAEEEEARRTEQERVAAILGAPAVRETLQALSLRSRFTRDEYLAVLRRQHNGAEIPGEVDRLLNRLMVDGVIDGCRYLSVDPREAVAALRSPLLDAAGIREALDRWSGIATLDSAVDRLVLEAVSEVGLRPLASMTRGEIGPVLRVAELLHGLVPGVPTMEQVAAEVTLRHYRDDNLMRSIGNEFAGRDAELDALEDALRGKAGVVVVDGPEGSGKTTLIAQAARTVCLAEKARPLVYLSTYGHPSGIDTFSVVKAITEQIAAQFPEHLDACVKIKYGSQNAYWDIRKSFEGESITAFSEALRRNAQQSLCALGQLLDPPSQPVVVIDDLDGYRKPERGETRSWSGDVRRLVEDLQSAFPGAVLVLAGRAAPADIRADQVIRLDEVPGNLPKPL